jgi:hypothetical protein
MLGRASLWRRAGRAAHGYFFCRLNVAFAVEPR